MKKKIKTAKDQEKIIKRFNQTYDLLQAFSIEELKGFVDKKFVVCELKSFKTSNTDLLAIHRLIQAKQKENVKN